MVRHAGIGDRTHPTYSADANSQLSESPLVCPSPLTDTDDNPAADDEADSSADEKNDQRAYSGGHRTPQFEHVRSGTASHRVHLVAEGLDGPLGIDEAKANPVWSGDVGHSYGSNIVDRR